jgi:hypothetical protein
MTAHQEMVSLVLALVAVEIVKSLVHILLAQVVLV